MGVLCSVRRAPTTSSWIARTLEKAGAVGADWGTGQVGRQAGASPSPLSGLPSPALQSWPSMVPVILEKLDKVLELFIPWSGCLIEKLSQGREKQDSSGKRPIGTGYSVWSILPVSSCSLHVLLVLGQAQAHECGLQLWRGQEYASPALYILVLTISHLLSAKAVAPGCCFPGMWVVLRSFQGLNMQLQRARATSPIVWFLSIVPGKS